jgi:hypothetical protein
MSAAIVSSIDALISATAIPTNSPSTEAPSPNADARPEVTKPSPGQPLSEFAAEIGVIMSPKNVWFTHNDTVVEVKKCRLTEEVEVTQYHPVTPIELRTSLEQHVKVGFNERSGFVEDSISKDVAAALLASPQFKEALSPIYRILDVPIPLIHDGQLVFTAKGYDSRFHTYCPEDAPDIESLTLAEAKELIEELHRDFPFNDEASRTMAVARVLTPFVRGLMGFSARPPIWIFEANRPRSGKDYLAGCTQMIYQGQVVEDAPLDQEPEETRKRLTAALISGRRFMHFANCEGYIRNNSIEQIATTAVYSGRKLGTNDNLNLTNEIEYSLSANTGFQYSEDLDLRSRKITLSYFQEDANARSFTRPDLHGWIRQNRGRFLGAMAAFVREWDRQGRPAGPSTFASFPRWAIIVGGIMAACGLGDPCAKQSLTSLTGDEISDQMKAMFAAAHEKYRDQWISKNDIYGVISENDLFSSFDLNDRKHQTSFGVKLKAYERRELGGLRMEINEEQRRPRYRFVRTHQATTLIATAAKQPETSSSVVTLDTLATFLPPATGDSPSEQVKKVTKVTEVTKPEPRMTISLTDSPDVVRVNLPKPPMIRS